jgi:Short C-terminal domain
VAVEELAAVAPQPTPSSAPTLDPADQIRKLAQLRDDGLITEEEFQEKRTSLLAQM